MLRLLRAVFFLCFALVGCLSLYFAVRSVILAREASSLPFGDHWWFYMTYFNGMSLAGIFDRHNEHVIATTRLLLWADTAWLSGSGALATTVSYVLNLASVAIIAWLTTGRKWEAAALSVCFLGLAWSFAQLDNLTLPFQAQFPLVHFFALVTLVSLGRGLCGPHRWYLLAVACDFAAVFSLGSGILVGASAVALAVWLRRYDRWFVAFLIYHALIMALFLWLIQTPTRTLFVPGPLIDRLAYLVAFLGNFALAPVEHAIIIGSCVAVICAALFLYLTLWPKAAAQNVAILAAFVLFTALEGATGSLNRIQFGTSQALEIRYMTCTLLMVTTMFALAWRSFSHEAAKIAVLMAAAWLLVSVNNSFVEAGWKKRNFEVNGIASQIARGVVPANAAASLLIDQRVFDALIWRLRDSKLAYFRSQ